MCRATGAGPVTKVLCRVDCLCPFYIPGLLKAISCPKAPVTLCRLSLLSPPHFIHFAPPPPRPYPVLRPLGFVTQQPRSCLNTSPQSTLAIPAPPLFLRPEPNFDPLLQKEATQVNSSPHPIASPPPTQLDDCEASRHQPHYFQF